MKFPQNIKDISVLHPDYMGFIFYPQSPRYIGNDLTKETFDQLPGGINKVGIFVNESINKVVSLYEELGLDYIQLHGDESPSYCRSLKNNNCNIIKAFGIDGSFDFQILSHYKYDCDLFLFDTKVNYHGGSGQVFDWNLLDNYTDSVPFLLSGGIGPDNIEEVLALKHDKMHGIDLNSRLETTPAMKSITITQQVIHSIRSHEFN